MLPAMFDMVCVMSILAAIFENRNATAEPMKKMVCALLLLLAVPVVSCRQRGQEFFEESVRRDQWERSTGLASCGDGGWRPIYFGPERIFGIWPAGPNDVFAAVVPDGSSQPAVLHFDGATWSPIFCDKTATEIWGTSPKDVWAIGGGIAHYDGISWTPAAEDITKTLAHAGSVGAARCGGLNGIWGASASDIFAVGVCGVILHYDGAGWSLTQMDPAEHLYRVWGLTGRDVYAIGWCGEGCGPEDGIILHYDGSGWSTFAAAEQLKALNSGDIADVWGPSAADIYFAGDGIFHYDGKNITAMKTPAPIMSRYDRLGGRTLDGQVMRAKGFRPPTQHRIRSIWGTSAANIYATGEKAYIFEPPVLLHYGPDGVWREVDSGRLTVELGRVTGTSPKDVYVVGATSDNSIILHYDGKPCEKQPSETPGILQRLMFWR